MNYCRLSHFIPFRQPLHVQTPNTLDGANFIKHADYPPSMNYTCNRNNDLASNPSIVSNRSYSRWNGTRRQRSLPVSLRPSPASRSSTPPTIASPPTDIRSRSHQANAPRLSECSHISLALLLPSIPPDTPPAPAPPSPRTIPTTLPTPITILPARPTGSRPRGMRRRR